MKPEGLPTEIKALNQYTLMYNLCYYGIEFTFLQNKLLFFFHVILSFSGLLVVSSPGDSRKYNKNGLTIEIEK